MKNKKRFVPWLIAAVIIAAFAVIGKKLYDLMFGGSLAVTTEDLKNGIIACSPAIIFIVVVLIAALIVVVAAGKLKQPKRALVRAQAPIAILLAITLSVNWVILGVEYSVVNSVFAEDVKVSDETMASGRAIADQIASEGIVLLKNDDKALPLSAGTKLNLFGWSSVRPLYGGTGSGDSDTSNAVSLIDGLKHAGFEVNEELVKFYENFRTERPVGTIRLREIGSKRGDFTVPEPTIAEYENANIFEDWIREGGLFVIVCNLITVFKYILLQFLPAAFANMPKVDFGWPGIEVTMLGATFKWNILGYDAEHGGLPYFCAYMIAMILGEVINFPIQRNVVFRSKGNLTRQIVWYAVAFCVITCIVNSINCIWVATAARYVPDFIYNIGTTILNGGVSMVIFFFVNKVIFPTSD